MTNPEPEPVARRTLSRRRLDSGCWVVERDGVPVTTFVQEEDAQRWMREEQTRARAALNGPS